MIRYALLHARITVLADRQAHIEAGSTVFIMLRRSTSCVDTAAAYKMAQQPCSPPTRRLPVRHQEGDPWIKKES